MIDCVEMHHNGTQQDRDSTRLWDEWRTHVSPFFDLAERDETDLSQPVAMKTFHLGALLVGDVVAPAQDLVREARKSARQGVDHVLIQFYTKGRSRIETRQERLAAGGGAVIYDLSQPVTVRSDQAVDAVNILLPRVLLSSEPLRVEALHGQVADFRADAAGQIAFTTIQGIMSCADRLTPQHLPALTAAAARLCSGFLSGAQAQGEEAEWRARVEIRHFIRSHLHNPDLGVELLQRRFGLSRAALYREFAGEGGVQTFIRERRLAAALRLLTRPSARGGRPRVSSVAYATGFTEDKSFSRAFKTKFGFLPSEVRAGEMPAMAGDDKAGRLLAWLRDLTGEPAPEARLAG